MSVTECTFEFAIQRDTDFTDGARKPTRGTVHSAGYDFYSPTDVLIPAGKTVAIKTGITSKMPKDVVLILKSRSSLALKSQITTEGGVIDSDYYPNDIGVILHNSSGVDFQVHAGDKISQGIFIRYLTVSDDPQESTRMVRTGGFGSTNVKPTSDEPLRNGC